MGILPDLGSFPINLIPRSVLKRIAMAPFKIVEYPKNRAFPILQCDMSDGIPFW